MGHCRLKYVLRIVPYHIAKKIRGIKFCKFALKQNISRYKFCDLRAGISKFAG